jgi:hypothetical protein
MQPPLQHDCTAVSRATMRIAACRVVDSEIDDQPTRSYTVEEFSQIQRAQSLIGSVMFWRTLDRLAHPEAETRSHAMFVLRELAELAFADCGGHAFSPQEAECFRYCGMKPAGVRSAGSVGKRIDTA